MNPYSEDEMHRSLEIGRLVEKRRLVNDAIEAEVKCARKEDMSWAKIGLALGTSAQSAWQRYGLTYQQRMESLTSQDVRFAQELIELDLEVKPPTKKNQPRKKQHRSPVDR